MKLHLSVCLFFALAVSPTCSLGAEPPKKGQGQGTATPNEFVFAYWDADGLWYPARIEKADGEKLFVRFYDGDSKWIDVTKVGRYRVQVGDWVYGNWKNKGLFYSGTIARLNGEKV